MRTALINLRSPSDSRSNVAGLWRSPVNARPMHRPWIDSPRPQAGFPSPAADYVEQALDLNELMIRNAPATFFATMGGESLIDLGIMHGDIVVVDRSIEAKLERIVLASLDGDLYIKVLGLHKGRLALLSRNERRNSEFPPLFFDRTQDHEIFGVVTGMVRKF